MDALVAFADRRFLRRAVSLLETLRIEYAWVSQEPACSRVGCPALVVSEGAKGRLLGSDLMSTSARRG